MKSERRFWNRVWKKQGGECWVWLGYRLPSGYGQFWDGSKTVRAHRFSWGLAYGEIPAGFDVCHHCDNPPCVRPDHLYVGTAKENTLDSYRRGRRVAAPSFGERNGSAKLTEDQVKKIREIASSWNSSRRALAVVLGSIYGISRPQAMNIVDRRNWRHV